MGTLTYKSQQVNGLGLCCLGTSTYLSLAINGDHLWTPRRKLSAAYDGLDASQITLMCHVLDCILEKRGKDSQKDQNLLCL
jgi:hypothetical protein